MLYKLNLPTTIHSPPIHNQLISKKTPNIKILSYNIFLRPLFISHEHSDYKDDRCKIFSELIHDYDIIILQEVHTCFNFRCNILIENSYKHGLVHYHLTNGSSMFSKHLSNNALLILSRFPIIKNDYISYNNYSGYDGIIEKGCNYCKIEIETNKYIQLFNTHLQASFGKNDTDSHNIRLLQLKQIRKFIQEKKEIDNISPIICCGDFNINVFNKSEKTELYNAMLPLKDIFRNSNESSIDILYDSNNMENENICNVCKLCKENINLNYSINKQRLDYIFINENDTKIKLINNKIVPFNINSKNFPFVKLSDHSALYAEFSLL